MSGNFQLQQANADNSDDSSEEESSDDDSDWSDEGNHFTPLLVPFIYKIKLQKGCWATNFYCFCWYN